MARPFTPLADRLWAKIDKRGPDECWPWTASTNWGRKGRGGPYGYIGLGGQRGGKVSAHRLVYEFEVGQIPDGFHVDHCCGNSLCCNPRHLEAVPPWLNNARSSSPTSHNIRKTECPQGHEYDEANTGYRKGDNYRYCRACAREARAAKRLRGLSYPEWLAEKAAERTAS